MIILKNIRQKNSISINNLIGDYFMPRKNEFISFTEKEIALLSDPTRTVKEIAKLLGVGVATVCRARRRFNITVPLGWKAGVPRPWMIKKELRTCMHPNCNNTFLVVPSKKRNYCSHKCHSLTLDNSHLQSPEILAKRTNPNTPEFLKYKRLVHRLSSKNYEDNKHIINPNNYKRTLCGVEGGYQLDHIISIKECYEKKISPKDASSLSNLRMLPWKQNLMRQYDNRS